MKQWICDLFWRIIRILEYPIWIIWGTIWGYKDDFPRLTIKQRFIRSHQWWWYLVKNLYF